jgi:hypothetical protein
MNKYQLAVIFTRLIVAIVIIKVLFVLFPTLEIKPLFFSMVGGLFAAIDALWPRIKQSDKDILDNAPNYSEFLHLTRELTIRNNYFNSHWWVAFLCSVLAASVGAGLEYISLLAEYKQVLTMTCLVALLVSIPTTFTFIRAYKSVEALEIELLKMKKAQSEYGEKKKLDVSILPELNNHKA